MLTVHTHIYIYNYIHTYIYYVCVCMSCLFYFWQEFCKVLYDQKNIKTPVYLVHPTTWTAMCTGGFAVSLAVFHPDWASWEHLLALYVSSPQCYSTDIMFACIPVRVFTIIMIFIECKWYTYDLYMLWLCITSLFV